MKLQSRIVELTAPQKLRFKQETLDLGRMDAHAVAARTLYSAISPGTEISAYRGDPPLRPGNIYPRVVGYCNAAEVVAVGAAVTRWREGDFVLSFESHRSAFLCNEDQIITRIPAEADLQEASLTYLFHLGYNALQRGVFRPGHNVAVIGLGTLGLAACALIDQFGGQGYALSNQQGSLERAVDMGARLAIRKDDDRLFERLTAETEGTGIDLVITTSNSWQDWRLALELTRKDGVIAVIGFPGRGQSDPEFNPLDSQYLYDKQLRIVGCGYTPDLMAAPHDLRFTRPRNIRYLLDMIVRGKLPAAGLISGVHKWQDIEAVYQKLLNRKSAVFTYVLDWK
jgi:threonine dehydrogenase-like Zn-dependent dehydrogenase